MFVMTMIRTSFLVHEASAVYGTENRLESYIREQLVVEEFGLSRLFWEQEITSVQIRPTRPKSLMLD